MASSSRDLGSKKEREMEGMRKGGREGREGGREGGKEGGGRVHETQRRT
jgi:hypothetical protein